MNKVFISFNVKQSSIERFYGILPKFISHSQNRAKILIKNFNRTSHGCPILILNYKFIENYTLISPVHFMEGY